MTLKSEIILLIDFDNYFVKPIEGYSIQEFEYELKIIIDHVTETIEENRCFILKIRLYSGWFENSRLTKKTSETLQKIAGLSLFPIILSNKSLINGQIDIATTLYDIPEYTFENTYREKQGVPRIRVNQDKMDSICQDNKKHCPAHLLTNFTKKKNKICHVEGCSTNHNEIFFLREQKMVDTMIACDLITFCECEYVESIFLISDDIDHIPALICGSKRIKDNKSIELNIKNRWNEDFFRNILNQFNIKTNLLS